MLDTLRNLDDHDALMLLSSTVHSLLPDPGVGSRITDVLNAPAQSREQLLHELRHKLKLTDDDQSPVAQAKIFDTLSSEISKYALKNADLRQIRARLGNRGDLDPLSYEVEIPRLTEVGLSLRGIRASHIEEAIHMPDAVQHVNSNRHEFLVSLFCKNVGIGSADAFTLLVVGLRKGYTLRVCDALRIYHSDVGLRGGDAVGVLRAFLRTYGVTVQVGHLSGLLLLDEVFPFSGGGAELRQTMRIGEKAFGELPSVTESFSASDRGHFCRDTEFGSIVLSRHNPLLSVVEVAIAYAYNARKYREDLRRHGVPVPPG
jgi:hypothetical protein